MKIRRLLVPFALVLGLLTTVGLLHLLGAQSNGPTMVQAHNRNTLTVCQLGPPDCQYSSIQAAADAAGEGDLVKVARGIYTGVQGRPAPPGYQGPSIITQVLYLSKTLTVQGGYSTSNNFADPPDPEVNPTTLDAQRMGRVLFIGGAISPTVNGLRITGGDATGLGGDLFSAQTGGGAYFMTAATTLRDCRVFNNTAGQRGSGGGLFLYQSDSTLQGNTIDNNSAGFNGGGLFLWLSDAILSHNTITANTAITFGGGANLFTSHALIEENTVHSNHAPYGGGIQIDASHATLVGNTVVSNTAIAGGGLYLQYSGWSTPLLVISNTVSFNSALLGGGLWLLYAPGTFIANVITGNQAQDGGGLATFSSDALLERNTFGQNTAYDQGGGMYLYYANPTLTENRFSDNSADTGGGIHLWNSNARLDQNTFSDNHARDGGGLWLYQSPGTLLSNTISSNSAGRQGGGLYLHQSDAQMTNNLVVDNQAEQAGGGLYLLDSAPHLLHSTLARNGGGDGSGIHIAEGDLPWLTVSLTNTILVSHSVGITVISGCTVTLEATLWGSGTWANAADWAGEGAIFTGTVNLWEAPRFTNPDSGDYHIGLGSAAIDAGVNAGVTVDLDGEPRPIGLGYDIGADEFSRAAGLLYLPLVGLNH